MLAKIVGVDKYCPYDNAQIFEQYNATLVQPFATSESYHILQIVTANTINGDKYIVWNRCGVYHNHDYMDYRTQIYQHVFDNPYQAVEKFLTTYKSKTKTEYLDASAQPKSGAYRKIA